MNKIVQSALAAVLLLGAQAAQAQLSAGHLLIGGGVNYATESPQDEDPGEITKKVTGNFSPRIGYFVKENFVVGLDISYGGTREKIENKVVNGLGANVTKTTTKTTTQFGPFARYYKPLGDKAAFFGHLGLGFGGQKETVEFEGADKPDAGEIPKDIKYSIIDISLRPGFAYFITPRFGLELMTDAFSIGYNSKRKKEPLPSGAKDEDFTEKGFNATADLRDLINPLSWQIGASFYFGGN
jgi:hypothetical protein